MRKRTGSTTNKQDQAPLYMAIDGGGSKTDAVLFAADGTIKARSVGAATNPTASSAGQVEEALRSVVSGLKGEDLINSPDAIYAGVAGGSRHETKQKLQTVLSALMPNALQIIVGHDAVNALWSGTDGQPGIVLIAGTGTIAFGMDDAGEPFRVGGWGHLIGDEGSGYDLGRLGVKAVMDAFDGTGPKTVLTDAITAHLGVASPPELIPLLYSQGKSLIASLAPSIVQAAKQRDEVSVGIVEQVCSSLASLLVSIMQVAATRNGPIWPYRVVLSGSLWRSDLILQSFKRKLDRDVEAVLVVPQLPPVYGAALYMMKRIGNSVQPDFKTNFANSWAASE